MKRILLPLCVFTAVLAAQAPPPGGQEPPGSRAPRLDAVTSALNLTDNQITQLKDLRVALGEESRNVFDSIRTNTAVLRENVEASGDPAEIGKLVLQINTLRTQARAINENYHERAVAVLDAGQQDQLQKMEEAMKLQPAIPQARALMLLGPPEDRETGFMRAGRLGSQRAPALRRQQRRNRAIPF